MPPPPPVAPVIGDYTSATIPYTRGQEVTDTVAADEGGAVVSWSIKAEIGSINTQTNQKRNTATMRLRVEVPDLGSLSKLLERINRLKNVVSAVRVSE